MRQAAKQWLFLLFLVLSLLAMIALALRQMVKARREAPPSSPGRQDASVSVALITPASRPGLESAPSRL
ncbi:MAG: hypothetical protein WBC53_00725 [Phycisphaerae bacterium]